MTATNITTQDQSNIQKYFGLSLEELDETTFKRIQKELRSKYHPDKFEKFEDDTIREMATERFQLIESLSEKIVTYLSGSYVVKSNSSIPLQDDLFHQNARFAAKD